MKKIKIAIFVLFILIIVLLSFIIYINYFEEKVSITLFGNDEITLYETDSYYEYGFIAKNNKNEEINEQVVINGNLDTNIVGDYEINYSIKTGFRTVNKTRIVHIIENPIKNVDFNLVGNKVVNLLVNEEYVDPMFTCVNNETNEDLKDMVNISNKVDTSITGLYEIEYKLTIGEKEKSLRRIVYVLDYKYTYKLSNEEPTNKDVSINFVSNIKNFDYIILPNEEISYEENIDYLANDNGDYKFVIYDKEQGFEEYVVSVNNIDRISPTGTCNGVLLDGKTSYSVLADEPIDKYIYNDESGYTSSNNTYEVGYYIRESKVRIIDKAGNDIVIPCVMTLKALPVVLPKSNEKVKYKAESDSLILYITKQSGYILTRIWAIDPVNQMRKEFVSGDGYERPDVILKQAIKKNNLADKIVIGGNASPPIKVGSYYGTLAKNYPIYNLKEPSSLLIYNGKVIINDYEKYPSNTVIYYLDGSNQFHYINYSKSETVETRKKLFTSAINSGAQNTFTFNGPLVIDNRWYDSGSDYNAKRQGFCQLDTNNFLYVTSDTKTWPRSDFAKFMESLECKLAANFDGGGSVAQLYSPKGTSKVTVLAGNGRSMSSVMYFTELNK